MTKLIVEVDGDVTSEQIERALRLGGVKPEAFDVRLYQSENRLKE